jgi:hypothetical protein
MGSCTRSIRYCRYRNMSLIASPGEPVETEYDFFICHAGEDKEEYVRPLAHALQDRGLRVWYDEFALRPGDSLRRSIDNGLRSSKIAVVVLSPAFFGKKWPEHELDGIAQHYDEGNLIPIWHGVDHRTVEMYSPSLADKVAIRSELGIQSAADKLEAQLNGKSGAAREKELRIATVALSLEDAAITSQRAHELVQTVRRGQATMVIALACAPLGEVLRPAEFGDPDLRRRLLQAATFGDHAIFDHESGARHRLDGDAILLEQPQHLLRCDVFGSVLLAIPAVPRPASSMSGLPSLVREDVEERLENGLLLEADLLDIVDPSGRWTDASIWGALIDCQHLGWRTREEAQRNPNRLALNTRAGDAMAASRPQRLPRADLRPRAHELAEDLTELFGRQLTR